MLTPAGKQMSARAERIYSYINRKGVALTTLSTDMCVERALPALQKMHAALLDGTHGQSWSEAQVTDAARDLEAIMRRVPSNRVLPQRKR